MQCLRTVTWQCQMQLPIWEYHGVKAIFHKCSAPQPYLQNCQSNNPWPPSSWQPVFWNACIGLSLGSRGVLSTIQRMDPAFQIMGYGGSPPRLVCCFLQDEEDARAKKGWCKNSQEINSTWKGPGGSTFMENVEGTTEYFEVTTLWMMSEEEIRLKMPAHSSHHLSNNEKAKWSA